MLQPSLLQAVLGQQPNAGICEQVKWTLKRLLADSRPDIQAVARELGVSSRTLRAGSPRNERRSGTCLPRRGRSSCGPTCGRTRSRSTGWRTLVGYEDPNSFYRAFRSWEGTTPGHWRSRADQESTGA